MDVREATQRTLFAVIVRPFVRVFMGVVVGGRENLPQSGPFILVANHNSHLDTLVLLSLFPGRALKDVSPVAAEDYFGRNAFTRWFATTCFNAVLIPREGFGVHDNPLTRMSAALESGRSLLLFPEGTRGDGDETHMGAFEPGVAHVLRRAHGVPVVPVFLVGTGRSMPKGDTLPVPMLIEVHIGPALHPAGSRDEVMEELETAMESLATAASRGSDDDEG